MAKPFRKSDSSNYYVELWSHGKRQTIALETDNYGVAKARAGELEHQARTTGLSLTTQTAIAPLLEKFIQHMFIHQRFKSAQSDSYRLRECFGVQAPAAIQPGHATHRPRAGRKAVARRAPRSYEFAIKAHYVEQITPGILTDFLVRLAQQRQIGPKTWNEYRGAVHRFFAWAIETAEVVMPGRANPAAAVASRKVDPPTISFLNLSQVHQQLAALVDHPQIQAMVAVYLYAGVRREEALWLTPDDVDLERRVIHVRAKTVGGRSWRPKTNRNRRVAISQALHGVLSGYRSPSRSTWYFPAPQGGWWDPDNFSHALADLNQKAGLDWSCAEYRHTFGTQLAMAGRDERTIAELMGNSPEIVRRHYAAWLPEAHPEAVEFDTPLGPEPMADTRTANLRVEAKRRGLRVVSGK